MDITATFKDAESLAGLTLKLKKMEHVDKLCSFEHYIDMRKAAGALNFDVGRDSNNHCIVVAMEVLVTFTRDKSSPKLCSGKIEFPTVKVNGIFGTLDYPLMSKGMLKKQATRTALVEYVKRKLPDAHPLVRKGYRNLPAGYDTLDDEVACPGGAEPKYSSKRARPKHPAKGAKRVRLGDLQEDCDLARAQMESGPSGVVAGA